MVIYLGSLVQLCCREGGALQTNITGVCGECSQRLGHTGFAPAHGKCAFPDYTAQAPGCSARELSKAGPGLRALPRCILLRFWFSGTPQRHRLSWTCVLCLSQVRAAQVTRLGQRCILSPPPSQPFGFLGAQWEHLLRCAVCLLWGADLAATLLADVNHPGSQDDLISNWKPVHSLVEDAPCLPALAVACLPPCLQQGMGQSTAG